MTGLILKDFLVMRKTIKTYALLLLFYVIMTVLDLFSISFTTAILEVIVMMLPMSAFSYDEMAKWDRYAMTLPLGRRAVVTGRYGFALIMTLFAGVCGMLSCVLVSIFDGQGMVLENIMTVMACLGLGLLYCDILLPLCYKLGPERARPYMYAVLFVPIVLFFGAAQLGFLDGLGAVLTGIPEGVALAGALLFPLIPLVGMGISYAVSCRIIEKKEF